jgi:hypothetical protein
MIIAIFAGIKSLQTFPADVDLAAVALDMVTAFDFLKRTLAFWTVFDVVFGFPSSNKSLLVYIFGVGFQA